MDFGANTELVSVSIKLRFGVRLRLKLQGYIRVRVTNAGLVAVDAAHTVSGMDPDDPANITVFRAFEYTHGALQSFLLKNVASQNM